MTIGSLDTKTRDEEETAELGTSYLTDIEEVQDVLKNPLSEWLVVEVAVYSRMLVVALSGPSILSWSLNYDAFTLEGLQMSC